MAGVICVGAQLPAVICPVVIRPSGGLTPLISSSLFLAACLFGAAQSVRLLALNIFMPTV